MAALSIIVPHLSDFARLRLCLDALAPQIGVESEVIVVDNGTPEGLEALAQDYGWVRFVVESAPGAGPARNAGVAASSAPYLAFLDCDCVPGPDWVRRALHAAQIGRITGGRITLFDEGAGPRNGAQLFEHVFAFDNARYIARKGFSVTANLVTTRVIWDRVGPFEGGLSEDVNWCHRARGLGVALRYDPGLVVGHPTRSDWAALCRKWQRVGRERFESAGKPRWAAMMVLTSLSPLKDMWRVLGSRRLRGPVERLRCLWTLICLRELRAIWMGKQLLS